MHRFAFALAQDADELEEGAHIIDAGVPLRIEYEVTTSGSTYSWAVLSSSGGSTRTGKEDPESEVGRCVHAPLLTGHLSLPARETEIFVPHGRKLIVEDLKRIQMKTRIHSLLRTRCCSSVQSTESGSGGVVRSQMRTLRVCVSGS